MALCAPAVRIAAGGFRPTAGQARQSAGAPDFRCNSVDRLVAVTENPYGSRSSIESRAIRGGSWNNNARNVRCACRNQNSPRNSNNNLGFRLVRAHDRPGWAVLNRLASGPAADAAVGKNEMAAGVLVEVGGCPFERSPDGFFSLSKSKATVTFAAGRGMGGRFAERNATITGRCQQGGRTGCQQLWWNLLNAGRSRIRYVMAVRRDGRRNGVRTDSLDRLQFCSCHAEVAGSRFVSAGGGFHLAVFRWVHPPMSRVVGSTKVLVTG